MLSGAKHLQYLLENEQMQILRAVYPEREKLQTLRFAQGDSEGLRMTSGGLIPPRAHGADLLI